GQRGPRGAACAGPRLRALNSARTAGPAALPTTSRHEADAFDCAADVPRGHPHADRPRVRRRAGLYRAAAAVRAARRRDPGGALADVPVVLAGRAGRVHVAGDRVLLV